MNSSLLSLSTVSAAHAAKGCERIVLWAGMASIGTVLTIGWRSQGAAYLEFGVRVLKSLAKLSAIEKSYGKICLLSEIGRAALLKLAVQKLPTTLPVCDTALLLVSARRVTE